MSARAFVSLLDRLRIKLGAQWSAANEAALQALGRYIDAVSPTRTVSLQALLNAAYSMLWAEELEDGGVIVGEDASLSLLHRRLHDLSEVLQRMEQVRDEVVEMAGDRSVLQELLWIEAEEERQLARGAKPVMSATSAARLPRPARSPSSRSTPPPVTEHAGIDIEAVLQCVDALLRMYEEELLLKKRIVSALGAAPNENTLRTYAMVWEVEPCLEVERIEVIDACLDPTITKSTGVSLSSPSPSPSHRRSLRSATPDSEGSSGSASEEAFSFRQRDPRTLPSPSLLL